MSTYVCSDIHGLKNRYDQMIQQVQKTDHLYILGDVIDRGAFGIEILWDLMHRDNVTMLLGNHEFMMKQYYEAKRERKFPLPKQYEVMSLWRMNHCDATITGFDKLTFAQQEEVLAYLDRLPVAICDLVVEHQMYYLVHGYPLLEATTGTLYASDVLALGYEVERLVWNRVQQADTFFQDRTVIIGHTPTLYLQTDKPYTVWCDHQPIKEATLINIDCGCAADNAYTQLALLRLEDRKVFYF